MAWMKEWDGWRSIAGRLIAGWFTMSAVGGSQAVSLWTDGLAHDIYQSQRMRHVEFQGLPVTF